MSAISLPMHRIRRTLAPQASPRVEELHTLLATLAFASPIPDVVPRPTARRHRREVRDVIAYTRATRRTAACEDRLAAEYGEHPEQAAARMSACRAAVRAAFRMPARERWSPWRSLHRMAVYLGLAWPDVAADEGPYVCLSAELEWFGWDVDRVIDAVGPDWFAFAGVSDLSDLPDPFEPVDGELVDVPDLNTFFLLHPAPEILDAEAVEVRELPGGDAR